MAKGKVVERQRYDMAWQVRTTAALIRMKKGAFPSVDQLLGIKPIAKRQSPEEAKSVFAAMREAAQA